MCILSADGHDDVIGGYDEASIRYMGRNIPSKSFRMLQSMTGGNDVTDSAQGACNTDAPDECVVFLNVLLQNTLQCLYRLLV